MIRTSTVQYPATVNGTDMLNAFVAEPTTNVRHPAVIVIHTWWGLNDFVKQQAQKLAEQGFVALAPDLYDGHVATDPSSALELRMGLKDGIAIGICSPPTPTCMDAKTSTAIISARLDGIWVADTL